MRPGPPRRRRGPAFVALAATALLTGCGIWPHDVFSEPARSTTTTASAASDTTPVPGSELVRLWRNHPPPCEHPVGVGGKPADPYHLLEAVMWPSSDDVAARLDPVTATGGQEFVRDRLTMLDVVLRQSQADIADEVETGTRGISGVQGDPTAEAVIRDSSVRVIKLRHDNYLAAVTHITGELELGSVLPSAQLGHKYRMDRVCPDR